MNTPWPQQWFATTAIDRNESNETRPQGERRRDSTTSTVRSLFDRERSRSTFATIYIVIFAGGTALGARIIPANSARIGRMIASAPASWKISQLSQNKNVTLASFSSPDGLVRLFAIDKERFELSSLYEHSTDSDGPQTAKTINGKVWEMVPRVDLKHTPSQHMTVFKSTFRGYTYYGYSRSLSRLAADQLASSLLATLEE